MRTLLPVPGTLARPFRYALQKDSSTHPANDVDATEYMILIRYPNKHSRQVAVVEFTGNCQFVIEMLRKVLKSNLGNFLLIPPTQHVPTRMSDFSRRF